MIAGIEFPAYYLCFSHGAFFKVSWNTELYSSVASSLLTNNKL